MSNRNKALTVTGCIMLVIAAVLFIVGGYLAGWDFVAYFRSQSFIWLCILLGLYAIGAGVVLIRDKINGI